MVTNSRNYFRKLIYAKSSTTYFIQLLSIEKITYLFLHTLILETKVNGSFVLIFMFNVLAIFQNNFKKLKKSGQNVSFRQPKDVSKLFAEVENLNDIHY